MRGTITVAEAAALLESMVPQRLAAAWDNVGLLLGRKQHKVEKILLALDLTEDTCRQACEEKADLLVTHHPVIFQPLKQMTGDTWRQELLLRLKEQQIAVYSMHTNLDCAAHGVNMALAKKLKIRDVFELDEECGLGRIGYLEEPQPDVRSFALIVKKHCGLLTWPMGMPAARCGGWRCAAGQGPTWCLKLWPKEPTLW